MRTVLYFSSPNCGYCKPIKGMIEDLKSDYEDNDDVSFKSIVVDPVDPATIEQAKHWSVRGVPTIIFLEKGEEIHRLVGTINKDLIVDGIERSI